MAASAVEVAAAEPVARKGVTFEPTSNSVLGKRGVDEADDMAIAAYESPSPKRSKRKKLKLARKCLTLDHPPTANITVPAKLTLPNLGENDIPLTLVGPPPTGTVCQTRSKLEQSAIAVPSTTRNPLTAYAERLASANYEIAELKEQLHRQDDRHYKENMLLRQEMMLDMMRSQDQMEKAMRKLLREKHHLSRLASEQQAEAEKQKKKVDEEKLKYQKAMLDSTFYKSEVDHLQALNKVLEEDLDELRQIENEDAAQRSRKAQGLPPAYGSLDDEDRFPSPHLHQDSGSFDVAVFKRTVRDDFMSKLNAAQNASRSLHPTSRDTDRSTDGIFYLTSFALCESSRSLKSALEHAENATTTNMILQAKKSAEEPTKLSQHLQKTKRSFARRDFVADRVAKTIVDLSWRVVSACELRPCTLRLERNEKARVDLAYKEVDEVLLEALRQAFTLNQCGLKKDSLLWQYQHYYTLLTNLRKAFQSLEAGISYSFFHKAWSWLGEQVETERMNAANRAGEERGQEEAGYAGLMGGSEVSSVAARSAGESCGESG